jgi:hypothetical protein
VGQDFLLPFGNWQVANLPHLLAFLAVPLEKNLGHLAHG